MTPADQQIPAPTREIPARTLPLGREPANGCPEQHCTLSYQTIATAQDVADACTALSVPGIDEVYCVVYGP